MTGAALSAIQVGRVAPLGVQRVASAYIKRAVGRPVTVGPLGVEGDEQADLTVHGGPDKAVYGYAAAHYARWADDYPALAEHFAPGSMGENLTIAGLVEDDLCVGDVHAIGDVRLQVCQPRQPCFKLALAFGEPRIGKTMVATGRSGWYYRVLAGGTIRPGNTVTLAERPNPDFAFPRLVSIVNRGGADAIEARALATMTGVAENIRRAFSTALATGSH